MEENQQELLIKRILVALDASTHSLAALEAAAELAANLEAELIGLYVEDENLLHLAGLPFASEVSTSSATPQPIDSDKMERQLRLQASQARRALAEAAEKAQARWRFTTVRGQVTASVLAAALEADLLAMGRVSRPLFPKSRLGSTARAASTHTKRTVLFMQKDSNIHYPVLVTYDGSAPAKQALVTAAHMVQAGGGTLSVILLAETSNEAASMEEEVAGWLARRELSADFHWLVESTVQSLAKMAQTFKNCVLVLGGDNPLLKADSLQELLDSTDCPVMLVR